jgi:hypothetical protein
MAPLCPPNSPDIDTVTASRSFPCRIALRYRPKISKTARKQTKSAEFPCDDQATLRLQQCGRKIKAHDMPDTLGIPQRNG